MIGCLSRIAGLLLIFFGLYLGAMNLAFASMIDPSLSDDAWRAEFWNKMATGGGWGGLGMGLVMMMVGGWLLVVPSSPFGDADSKFAKDKRQDEIV